VRPFSIMVREVAVPGEIDVTGWTRVALSTLEDACKRFGVETVLVGALANSYNDGSVETISIDDFTSPTPPEK